MTPVRMPRSDVIAARVRFTLPHYDIILQGPNFVSFATSLLPCPCVGYTSSNVWQSRQLKTQKPTRSLRKDGSAGEVDSRCRIAGEEELRTLAPL